MLKEIVESKVNEESYNLDIFVRKLKKALKPYNIVSIDSKGFNIEIYFEDGYYVPEQSNLVQTKLNNLKFVDKYFNINMTDDGYYNGADPEGELQSFSKYKITLTPKDPLYSLDLKSDLGELSNNTLIVLKQSLHKNKILGLSKILTELIK